MGSRVNPKPISAHAWTRFELGTVLTLIYKGVDPYEGNGLTFATELNEVLRGRGTYKHDTSARGVRDMLATIARNKKGALALTSRPPGSRRLTRLKKRVFQRDLAFDGAIEEWEVFCRKEEKAKNKALRLRRFIEGNKDEVMAATVGQDTQTGASRKLNMGKMRLGGRPQQTILVNGRLEVRSLGHNAGQFPDATGIGPKVGFEDGYPLSQLYAGCEISQKVKPGKELSDMEEHIKLLHQESSETLGNFTQDEAANHAVIPQPASISPLPTSCDPRQECLSAQCEPSPDPYRYLMC